MKCLRKGIVNRKILGDFFANLYFVYDALERQIDEHADHPVVSTIYFSKLKRTRQLAKDLVFYYGHDWCNEIRPSRKAIQYFMRLHALANDHPALLAAHAYVRYMCDLSDGQELRSIIRSALALPDGVGTALYEFKGLSTVEARRTFNGIYQDALNTMSLDSTLATELVDEANLAFKLNQAVMNELVPQLKASIGEAQWHLIMHETILSNETRRETAAVDQQLNSELAAAR